MADLQQRYLNILKMPRQAVTSSIPTFSATGTDDTSTLSKILKVLLYCLIFLFVIFCILMVINYILIYYKKTPIFDFGDSPNALISVRPQTTDWQKYWIDTFNPAEPKIATYNYTMIFDTIILNDKDFKSNRPNMLFYRKSGDRIQYNSETDNFSEFLDYTKENGTNSPNLYVTYNAHKSEIHIVVKLSKNNAFRTLEIPIISQQQYRIAVNITDKFIEVYKDGVWIKTLVFSKDGVPEGNVEDKFFYTPSVDVDFVRVRNLMLVSPIVTSGIIRNMGTATINLDDLKKEQPSNICSP